MLWSDVIWVPVQKLGCFVLNCNHWQRLHIHLETVLYQDDWVLVSRIAIVCVVVILLDLSLKS